MVTTEVSHAVVLPEQMLPAGIERFFQLLVLTCRVICLVSTGFFFLPYNAI